MNLTLSVLIMAYYIGVVIHMVVMEMIQSDDGAAIKGGFPNSALSCKWISQCCRYSNLGQDEMDVGAKRLERYEEVQMMVW